MLVAGFQSSSGHYDPSDCSRYGQSDEKEQVFQYFLASLLI
jgi:hypothetical protein